MINPILAYSLHIITISLVLREQEKFEERLKMLEGLSGLVVPKDELMDRRREIVREFSLGEGI